MRDFFCTFVPKRGLYPKFYCTMKRIIICLALFSLVVLPAFADKQIESSERRQPAWVGGMQEGYIIVATEDATLDAAQQKAITAIREQIVSAVATKVHSSTSITMQEVADNGDIRSHRELNTVLSVQAADIPYLADVSPSHAEAFYWAKMRRDDKSTYYHYHVKYPLSNSKLRQLVEQYEKDQRLIRDSLQAFASVDFASYDDLEAIMQTYSRLRQYDQALRDDAYHQVCDAIRQGYDRMLAANLHVEAGECTRSATQVKLMYQQTPLRHNIRPKVKSNCLTAIEVKLQGGADIVTYDYQAGCYDEDQNWLDITYTVNGKKLSCRKFIP